MMSMQTTDKVIGLVAKAMTEGTMHLEDTGYGRFINLPHIKDEAAAKIYAENLVSQKPYMVDGEFIYDFKEVSNV